jgi:hypothetical protein
MRFPSFLLILPIALSTLHGALAQTTAYVAAYASSDCTNINFSTQVFAGHAPNNCEFSACTAFSGAGVAHTVTMQRPEGYINGHDVHYGNITCLMYATTGCTGSSQLVTISGKTILICRSFSWGAESRGAEFYVRPFALEIAPGPLALIEVLPYHSANRVTRPSRDIRVWSLDRGLEVVRVSFWH